MCMSTIICGQFGKILGLLSCLLFSNLLSSQSMAVDKIEYTFSDCPMKIGETFLDEAQGSCSVYKYGNSGGASLNVLAYNQNLVVWASNQRAGTNRYYKHSSGKHSTKRYLQIWPYIKDNWGDIRAATPRTTYVSDELKVVLYEINLQREKNCIGFSKGYGNTEGDQGGAAGASDVMSALACPINVDIGKDELLSMLESIRVKTSRW